MTREEILSTQPGSELNIQVAQKIMGHVIIKDELLGHIERWVNSEDGSSVWSPVKHYSEDISTAESVVDKMVELGYKDAIHWTDFGGGKYTEAEAICKAALLALLQIEQSDRILRQALGDEEKRSR